MPKLHKNNNIATARRISKESSVLIILSCSVLCLGVVFVCLEVDFLPLPVVFFVVFLEALLFFLVPEFVAINHQTFLNVLYSEIVIKHMNVTRNKVNLLITKKHLG